MTARRRVVHSGKRPSLLPILLISSAILITILIIAYLLILYGHKWLLLFERAPSNSTRVITPLHLFFLLNLLIVSIIMMTKARGEASVPRPVHTAAPSSTTSGQCLTTVSPLGHELDQRSGMVDHAEDASTSSTMWMSRSMMASPDSRERPRVDEEEEHNCAEVSIPTTGSDYEQYIDPEHQSSRKVIVESFTNGTVDYTDNEQIDEQGCTKAGTDDTQRNAAEVMANESKQVAKFGEGHVQQKISDIGSNQERPLASTHFAHKKAHASKGPLKVLKRSTRKGDTLDATWKAICDDKSKQSSPCHHHRATLQKKGDCLTIRDKFDKESHMMCLSPSKQRRHSGISKRREFSIPRDELNARIESLISKVNQQRRIQREQSLLSYMEMVDRGA